MSEKQLVLVGNWHYIPGPRGCTVYEYHPDSAKLEMLDTWFPDLAAGQLAVDEARGIAYAVNETSEQPGTCGGGGGVVSIVPNGASGALSIRNQIRTFASCPSYLCLDRSGRFLVAVHHAGPTHVTKLVREPNGGVSSATEYNDAPVELIRLKPDGSLGEICDIALAEPRGCTGPNTHSILHAVICDPSGELYLVLDPGLSKIDSYRIDRTAGRLTPLHENAVEAGEKPRYGAFHPSLPLVYVNNEKSPYLMTFRYEITSGVLERTAVAPLQTEENRGKPTEASDIVISPDGSTLYVSDRGSNLIAVFSVGADGIPQLVENIPCGGRNPRGLAISPDGGFLLVANSDSPNIAVFSIGPEGRLSLRSSDTPAVCPAVIRFMKVTA